MLEDDCSGSSDAGPGNGNDDEDEEEVYDGERLDADDCRICLMFLLLSLAAK